MLLFARCVTLTTLTVASAAGLAAQPAQLVRDVATAPGLTTTFVPDFFYLVEFEHRLYFSADDGIHGRELWTSDGSSEGTYLVADICPGFCPGWGAWITVAGDRLYFVGDDGVHGRELWSSDGTAAGTRLVADIRPGLGSSGISWLTANGNGLYFVADDGMHGPELWTSDGSAAGTRMVIDLLPGAEGSSPDRLTLLPTGLVFSAEDGTIGREPWASGGTAASTVSLGDLRAGPEGSISPQRQPVTPALRDWGQLADRMVFAARDSVHGLEPFVTDGTPGGTALLSDIHGTGDSFPLGLLEFAGRLYFRADSPAHGFELWSTDAVADTRLVADINPGPTSTRPSPLGSAGGLLYLIAASPATGAELWKTDGTAGGTILVADINPGAEGSLGFRSLLLPPVPLGDSLFFFADDGTSGLEPWVSDGTGAGTRQVRDVAPGPSSTLELLILSQPLAFDGRVAFWAHGPTGSAPWVSDGTDTGTSVLAEVNTQRSSIDTCFWFHCPQQPTDADGRLYLRLNDVATGEEPWSSRGTPGTTGRVADINPAVVDGIGLGSFPFAFQAVGSTVVFDASPSSGEQRLFASSVPTAATQIGDLLSVQPGIFTLGAYFFTGLDGAGYELWRSDGSPGGTDRLIDLDPGPSGSFPTDLTPVGDELFFAAYEPVTGNELYATDGTGAGTRRVVDLVPGSGSSHPRSLTASGERLFFSARTDATGHELWVSHGRAANTRQVIDLFPGTTSGLTQIREIPFDHSVIVAADSGSDEGIFFIADDGVHGQELWWSDGSVAGTRLLGDLFPGPRGSEPRHLTAFDGRAFLVVDDGTHGRELWTSDGTAAGTRMVADLIPGTGSSLPAWLTEVDGILYFTAHRPDVGTELWRTDGTAAGTELVQDLFPGPPPSTPELLTASGRRLYFTANDGTHGFELWAMLLPGRVPQLSLSAAGVFRPYGRVTFTLTLHNPPPDTLPDAQGDEIVFVLPAGFDVLSVTADAGSIAQAEGTGTSIRWNGVLAPGETLTLLIESELTAAAGARTYTLFAHGEYDSDRDGYADQEVRSDDPTLPGDSDPTVVAVAAQTIDVPTTSGIGLTILALLLAAAALGRCRVVA